MDTLNLHQATQAYRRVRYPGSAPAWPERRPSRRWRTWTWAPAIGAAAALLVLAVMPRTNQFGQDFEPRQSAYSALKQVRSALPGQFGAQESLPALPSPPSRTTGFSTAPVGQNKTDSPA